MLRVITKRETTTMRATKTTKTTKTTDDDEDDEDDEDENGGVPSAPPSEMIAYGNGGVQHHEHVIRISNEHTIQPSNQPDEVLCDDVNE
jgi:hypothetical protein